MELSAEQKAKIEAPLKECLVKLADVLEQCAVVAAEVSENKVDDVVVPAVNPAAKAALLGLIAGMKL